LQDFHAVYFSVHKLWSYFIVHAYQVASTSCICAEN
jgi:hypothetical protein